ncbi:nucleotide-binding domain-containing protein [Aspergillus japonicus CBS 114.51]|uniref:Nucleotide-binding domain-containing protein n=2 Tax=Aspergillus TaxID=5052 RepID=A0A2V5HCL5_ASPV1|nr:nucleotide-binding domain-containing protein [Aspergillus japonicus CBS 114.51]PYI19564.1 nucleotide-binding domain-containing protein [Aspergillus violaceofuscus CBS 115571]RAH82014.1 nucleotide-binding domain-containing protein [Aspergillus japonicus CBS 114.51]
MQKVGIIGSGIIGLLSALTLTDAGYKVTIVARDLPGDESQDWASPWAGVSIFPHPDAGGESLQTENFKYFWALAHRDPTSGVQIIKATEHYDDRDDDSTIWYKTVVPRYRLLSKEKLPDGVKLGFTYTSMTINPAYLLPWIQKQLQARGVTFIRKTLSSIAEAKKITGAKIIVHASGLGAYTLAGDKNVEAIRGQTMFVKTDFVEELMMHQGSHYTYVIPRMFTNGAIIGGVSQPGNLERNVDRDLRADILQRVNTMTNGGLAAVDLEKDVQKDIVAFRPGRKGGYRLEAEGDVVHAYGFAGLGYIFSYGVAMKVRELVDSIVKQDEAPRSRL